MERRGGISRERLVQPERNLATAATASPASANISPGMQQQQSQVCMQMSDSAGILNVRIKPSKGNSLAACDNDAPCYFNFCARLARNFLAAQAQYYFLRNCSKCAG
jgi:hypothetical protein